MMPPKPRAIHFVTGGGSGATQVALDVACAQHKNNTAEVQLLLRRKSVPLPERMYEQIRLSGLPVRWVENHWPRLRVVKSIMQICNEFRPDVFCAHGYSEHIWGRKAALRAKVPRVIHIEHNFEKYSPFRLWQARRLASQTYATVGVSTSVSKHLALRGLASPKSLHTIVNGINLTNLSKAANTPLVQRQPDILMAARFSRQKDHQTLIHALAKLVKAGWNGRLFLAGGGKKTWRSKCECLANSLGLEKHVKFTGFAENMPTLLRQCRIFVLSTHYEGLPLSIVEAMAAGCLVVGSRVPGVEDVISDGENGHLFPLGDVSALAHILQIAIRKPEKEQSIANKGCEDAFKKFSLQGMVAGYDKLFS